jgi:hypothetical protein
MDGAAVDNGVGPLVEEATKKAAVAWLAVPGGSRALPAWCAWFGGALYVVTGPGEQEVPGLTTAASAVVTVRGDHGGRIVSWPGTASRLAPGGDEWDTVAPQLAGRRLNASGTAEQVVARWAEECVIIRLTPTGDAADAGRSMPDGSLAVPPPPSPATSATRLPFRLHRVGRPPA